MVVLIIISRGEEVEQELGCKELLEGMRKVSGMITLVSCYLCLCLDYFCSPYFLNIPIHLNFLSRLSSIIGLFVLIISQSYS